MILIITPDEFLATFCGENEMMKGVLEKAGEVWVSGTLNFPSDSIDILEGDFFDRVSKIEGDLILDGRVIEELDLSGKEITGKVSLVGVKANKTITDGSTVVGGSFDLTGLKLTGRDCKIEIFEAEIRGHLVVDGLDDEDAMDPEVSFCSTIIGGNLRIDTENCGSLSLRSIRSISSVGGSIYCGDNYVLAVMFDQAGFGSRVVLNPVGCGALQKFLGVLTGGPSKKLI